MSTPAHAVVLLAAGESRRLGAPKQLVVIDGEPLVRRAALAAIETRPAQALIVVGARAEAVWRVVADLPLTRVQCADWSEGLSASIHAALHTIESHVGAALFVLCDQPALRASHLQSLVERWRSDPGRAAASSYAGTVGVPAVLPRTWFEELGGLAGDRGARDLLRTRAHDVNVIESPGLANDMDGPADLARLRSR